MENRKTNHTMSRLDRLKTLAVAIALSLLGPVFLITAISWFVNGKVPGRGGGIEVADEPLLFYITISMFGAVSLILAPASLMFMIGYLRGRLMRDRKDGL